MPTYFKEGFEDYGIGANLIGTEAMEWTKRREPAAVTFETQAGVEAKLIDSGGGVGCVTCNHPNLISATDYIFSIHPTQIYFGAYRFWGITFRHTAAGGYYLEWYENTLFRLFSFSSWDPLSGMNLIADWTSTIPSMTTISEIKISVVGSSIDVWVDGVHWSTTDSTKTSGTIGLVCNHSGWACDDLCVYYNNFDPIAPINLASNILGPNDIELTWTRNSFDEIGFSIEKKVGASGSYSEIDVAPAKAEGYIDRFADPNYTNYYKVRAVK